MEGSIIVVFYSKYSKRCTDLFDVIRDTLDYRKICVDHPDIRSMILQESQKYSIRSVPCVLVFYANGVMNKYEDAQAFLWAKELTKTVKKSSISSGADAVSFSSKTTLFGEGTVAPSPTFFTPTPHQQQQEPIAVETITEENLIGMKRRIETSPLIQRNNEHVIDDSRMDGNRNEKKVHNKKAENIKNLAQMLQAEREKEDEALNPNAVSKISSPPVTSSG